MSNLGTIYEIDTNRNRKDKYPIVYMNKTWYYCKQYGSDELKRFYITHCYSLAEYNEKICKENKFYGNVFVSAKENINFPEIPDEIKFTYQLEEAKKQLQYCRTQKKLIEDKKRRICLYEKELKEKEESLIKEIQLYTDKLRESSSLERGNRSKMSIYEDSAGEKVKEELRRLL